MHGVILLSTNSALSLYQHFVNLTKYKAARNPKYKKNYTGSYNVYISLVIITQTITIKQFKIVKDIVSQFIHTN